MNLRPPGYELLSIRFSVAVVMLFALFHGKPGGRSPFRTTVSALCYPRMGQRMGQRIYPSPYAIQLSIQQRKQIMLIEILALIFYSLQNLGYLRILIHPDNINTQLRKERFLQ